MNLEIDRLSGHLREEYQAKTTYGSGVMSVVSPASRAVAPTVPRRSYIWPANSGNTAANVDRSALLLAIADAAIGRYATTRYVNVDVKMKYTPAPNGTDAMMGTIHGTAG